VLHSISSDNVEQTESMSHLDSRFGSIDDLPIVAAGQLVQLRGKHINDASNDYDWKCDKELAAFDGATPYTGTFQAFRSNIQRDLRETTIYRKTYAVLSKETSEHIGNVMYYGYDPLRQEAELGITIGNKEFWGRGYGREIVDLMVGVMASELSLLKVYLHTLTWNERAQRSFAASGFMRIGEVVRAGRSYYRMERLLPPE